MDTTLIGMLVTAVGTGIGIVALVSRSIGSLRSHMDGRIDALAHANQMAHDAIGARIDVQGEGLGTRIDAQGGRIDTLEARVARLGDDVAFIKGWVTAQPDG